MKHLYRLVRYNGKRLALGCLLGAGMMLSGFFVLDWIFPLPLESLHPLPSQVILDRHGSLLRITLAPDEHWRIPVKLRDVSPDLVRSLVSSEDRWFYWHFGVNPLAILRAGWTDLRSGEVVSGASTIPMQIARMMEPKPRTLWAKTWEAFRALQLEWHFPKKKLLEFYLNLAPYGGNLEGVGAASYFYFGKSPARLSLGEAALLTALPRSPNAYDPTRHPATARAVRDRVLHQLGRQRVFSGSQIAAALQQKVPVKRWDPPIEAPHFCRYVSYRFPDQAHLETELDLPTQKAAEKIVSAHIDALREEGVQNASVVVIENRNRAVRALVGSAGFFEDRFQGQVNGALARRSPGSTLKPFLYALAIDRGLIVPDSFLLDIPTDFSGYVTENYDGVYRGKVTVRRALIHSLNACTVRLLARVGLKGFLTLLRRGGLTSLDRPVSEYGLPLILGSGEVRLLDLTTLYVALANGGVYAPSRLLPGTEQPGRRLFSRESAYLVTQVLTKLQRPDLPESWSLARGVPTVAWKTGTSYGHRDAWSVGFSSRYTIGVWVGNFDGHGRKGISGAEFAAPILFDLFRALEPDGSRLPKPRGLRLETLEVCSLSHQLLGPFCPHRTRITYIPGKTHLTECDQHRRVFVDAKSGRILTGDCLARRSHKAKLLTVYPPELVAWWSAQGEPVPALPSFAPGCGEIPAAAPPRIVSPQAQTPYVVRSGAPLRFQKIRLTAQAGPYTARLFWYQDGTLVGSGKPDRPLFLALQSGFHRLVVVDDAGRTDSITYSVLAR